MHTIETVFALRLAALLSGMLMGVGQAADVESSTHIPTPHSRAMISQSDKTFAEQWKLSAAEWQRYLTLQQGIRGSLSNPTISPLEVLGIHAESDTERRRYAERWAQLMFEDTARVLAFQREYHTAFRRLYPNVPAIDLSLLRPDDAATDNVSLADGDRVLFFTTTACASCQRVLDRLLVHIGEQNQIGLDIYIVDTAADSAGDEVVRAWAREQAIPSEWVRTRQVTLNHDNGLLARFDPKAKLPYLLRQSQSGPSVLPLSEFSR